MLIAARVVSGPLLPTPLRILVVHLPHCVSAGMWSVQLLFLHRALDGHPFFPAHAVLGRYILTAASVCVPAAVISASAEPSSWHTPGLCWLVRWLVWWLFYGFCCPLPSTLRSSSTCLAPFPCACSPTLPHLRPASWGPTMCLPTTLACVWGTSPPPPPRQHRHTIEVTRPEPPLAQTGNGWWMNIVICRQSQKSHFLWEAGTQVFKVPSARWA